MNEHRTRIANYLSNLDGRAKLLFGLLAADRLRGCCFVACSESAVWESFASTVDQCFQMVWGPTPLDMTAIEEASTILADVVPGGGEPLQVQGQSSVICLLETFRFLSSDAADAAEGIVNAIVDALDNYIFFVRRSITGQTTSPEEYSLLGRELQRQLDDVEFVSQIGSLSRAAIIERRIDNLQYAIPIAVGSSDYPQHGSVRPA